MTHEQRARHKRRACEFLLEPFELLDDGQRESFLHAFDDRVQSLTDHFATIEREALERAADEVSLMAAACVSYVQKRALFEAEGRIRAIIDAQEPDDICPNCDTSVSAGGCNGLFVRQDGCWLNPNRGEQEGGL